MASESDVAVVVTMYNHRIGVVQQGTPAEDRQINHPLHCPRKGLHAGAFQHQRADIRMGAAKLRANPDHVFFGFIVMRFRTCGAFFRIPQRVKLRAAVFVLGAGDMEIAVQVNTYILQMGVAQESFLSTYDSDCFFRADIST